MRWHTSPNILQLSFQLPILSWFLGVISGLLQILELLATLSRGVISFSFSFSRDLSSFDDSPKSLDPLLPIPQIFYLKTCAHFGHVNVDC